jgi:hypothetical protein
MDNAFDDTAYDTVFDTSFGHEGGLPQDRQARLAARRAFVEMKLLFLRATASLEDRKGEWLDDRRHRGLRAELYRSLDSIFPEAFGFEPGASLPPTMPAPWEALAGEPRSPGGSYIR